MIQVSRCYIKSVTIKKAGVTVKVFNYRLFQLIIQIQVEKVIKASLLSYLKFLY